SIGTSSASSARLRSTSATWGCWHERLEASRRDARGRDPPKPNMRKSLPASVLCVLLAGCAAPVATPTPVATVAPTAEPSTVAPTPTVTWSPTPGPVTYPRRGPGTYAIATGTGPVAGASGTLLRYQVAVEH